MPPLKTIKFNLSKAPFLENSISGGGVSAASLATGIGVGVTGLPSIPSNSANSSNNKQRVHEPEPLPMGLLRPCNIADVSPGSIALVGFPYDEGARRSHLAAGSASSPGVLRFYLTKLLQSNLNTEFSIDLSNINILDVGDVPFGLSLEDALSRLNDAIVELIKRGAVPVVIGGSQDQSYPIAGGLMDVVGGNIGVVNINSRLSVNQLSAEMKIESASANRLLFSDSRFCPPKESYSLNDPACEGKLVVYGAQGTYCSPDHVNYLQRRGGHIIWLSKDIRKHNIYGSKTSASPSRRTSDASVPDDPFETHTNTAQLILNSSFPEDAAEEDPNLLTGSSNPSILTRHHSSLTSSAASSAASNNHLSMPSQFPKLLQSLSATPSSLTLLNRSLYVSFSLSAIQDMACPGMSLRSPQGFTSEEALLLCRQTGIDQNVNIFDIHDFNPTVEEARTGCLVAEMVYQFLLGYAHRRSLAAARSQSSRLGSQLSRNYSSRSRSPADSYPTNTSNPSLL